MILLDTNYLIRSLVEGSAEAGEVSTWLSGDEMLCTSSVVWYEFLCGPVDEDGVRVALALLSDRVIPFTADQAQEAARLFNACGRQRRLRVDAMIASAAIVAGAALATDNREDFRVFVASGLRLAAQG